MSKVGSWLAVYLMARKERVRKLILEQRLARHLALHWLGRAFAHDGTLDKHVRSFAFLTAAALLEKGETLNAYRLYKRLFRCGDPNGTAGWGMLRALMRKKRYRAADKVGAMLSSHGERFSGFYLYQAEIQTVLGDAPAARDSINRWREKLRSQKPNWREAIVASALVHAQIRPEQPPRHIALGGVSYVGSTILGMALGSIDGVENIGESHWLTEWRSPQGNRPIDFEDADMKQVFNCHRCGPNCAVLTRQFRRALAGDSVNWYEKISDQLGARRLVSSDKSLAHYWRLDPLGRYDLIVMYKSPLSSTQSHFRMLNRRSQADAMLPGGEHTTAIQHLDNWVWNYFGLLRNVHPRGKRLVVNWESFVQQPQKYMRIICAELDLPYDQNLFSSVRPQHIIGGNSLIDYRSIMETGKIILRSSDAPAVDAKITREVGRHEESQFVFRLLENEHWRVFGKKRD